MIVLDSSFLIGFHNERDAHHGAASVLMERFLGGEWGRGLLLEYIFLEVVTVLLARRDVEWLRASEGCCLKPKSWNLSPVPICFQKRLKPLPRQGNTRLSFADAAIAHVARQRTDGLVLTFDDELRKACLSPRAPTLSRHIRGVRNCVW